MLDDPSRPPPKLAIIDAEGKAVPQEWGKGYRLEEYGWGRRVSCSTDVDRIEFLFQLIEPYPGPFHIKYILEDNKGVADVRQGRYHSQDLTLNQVRHFLEEFGNFIRNSGRHNVMIVCESRTVVYDQHDYYYVYGDLDRLISELRLQGHEVMDYRLGIHGHRVEEETFDLHRLLRYWRWTWSDLEIADTSLHRVGWLKWLRLKLRALWFDRTQRYPK